MAECTRIQKAVGNRGLAMGGDVQGLQQVSSADRQPQSAGTLLTIVQTWCLEVGVWRSVVDWQSTESGLWTRAGMWQAVGRVDAYSRHTVVCSPCMYVAGGETCAQVAGTKFMCHVPPRVPAACDE